MAKWFNKDIIMGIFIAIFALLVVHNALTKPKKSNNEK